MIAPNTNDLIIEVTSDVYDSDSPQQEDEEEAEEEQVEEEEAEEEGRRRRRRRSRRSRRRRERRRRRRSRRRRSRRRSRRSRRSRRRRGRRGGKRPDTTGAPVLPQHQSQLQPRNLSIATHHILSEKRKIKQRNVIINLVLKIFQ